MPHPIIDIKPPHGKGARSDRTPPAMSASRGLRPPRRRRAFLRWTLASILVGVLVIVFFYGAGLYRLKLNAQESVPSIAADLEEARRALTNLEPGRAQELFRRVHEKIGGIAGQADELGLSTLASLWGTISPKLAAVPRMLTNLLTVSEAAVSTTADLETMKREGLGWVVTGGGDRLVATLTRLKDKISALGGGITALKNGGDSFGVPFPGDYLALATKLYTQEQLLGAILRWLSADAPRHLAILFQNPSEIRPGGGFIGSYADLALARGSMTNLKVWDIYDPDGQLKTKVIPPKQLQGITGTWGARDANWFFDFPASAKKVIEFLNASQIYRDAHEEFDGAIAVNVAALGSILTIVGPIELPEYRLTIDAENFLEEIQREVEAGEDKAQGEPKRILKLLTPRLLARLGTLSAEEERALLADLTERFKKKDIMIFFNDLAIQSYLAGLGITGDVAKLPVDFEGEYLAVVNANVAGGKSDAVVSEHVKLSSKIAPDGTIQNFLNVTRSHSGAAARDPWYRAPNRDYIKIFTPRGSHLTYLEGNDIRAIRPAVDYEAAAYLVDRDLRAIEETARPLADFHAEETEESGKTAFGTWLIVPAGKERQLELAYTNPVKLNLRNRAIPYRFIYDRQSGVTTALDFFIEAPPGFMWKETNGAAFNFTTDDPPGHLELSLTLQPIP